MKSSSLFRMKLLVFPKFQLVLVAANTGVFLMVAGITWLQVSQSFSELSPAAGLSGMEAEYFKKYLEYHSSQIQMSLLLSLALGLLISGFVTLLISHRFSGPLIRLRNFFQSIAGGAQPLPRLSFRRGDFLGDIPPAVNEALDAIESRALDERQAS